MLATLSNLGLCYLPHVSYLSDEACVHFVHVYWFAPGVEGVQGAYKGEKGLVEDKVADISTQRSLLLH